MDAVTTRNKRGATPCLPCAASARSLQQQLVTMKSQNQTKNLQEILLPFVQSSRGLLHWLSYSAGPRSLRTCAAVLRVSVCVRKRVVCVHSRCRDSRYAGPRLTVTFILSYYPAELGGIFSKPFLISDLCMVPASASFGFASLAKRLPHRLPQRTHRVEPTLRTTNIHCSTTAPPS